MEIGQLKAFEQAVREGSFTRAADKLNLTQPSVSSRIAALEAELGGTLFERGGRQLRLTNLGRMFLPYAERALTAVIDGLEVGQRYAASELGQVTMAALDTLAMYLLPSPMARFRAEYPAIDLSVKFRLQREIFELLHDRMATLGLVGAPLWDKRVTVQAHFREPVQVVVAASHPLADAQSPLSLSDIYDHTIYRITLNPGGTALVESIVEQARAGSGGAIVALPAIMTTPLLLQGEGVAFLTKGFVQAHVDAGRLVCLDIGDMPSLYHETLLISLAERPLDQPNTAFVKMIRAQWRHILVN